MSWEEKVGWGEGEWGLTTQCSAGSKGVGSSKQRRAVI